MVLPGIEMIERLHPPRPEMPMDELIREARLDERAIQRGVRDALIRHKQLGQSIAVWRDGRVVIVSAEDIEIPPEPPADDEPPIAS